MKLLERVCVALYALAAGDRSALVAEVETGLAGLPREAAALWSRDRGVEKG